MKKIIVYSTPACPYCLLVKDFLKENKVDFEDLNVAADQKAREEMIEKTGQLGVPVVDIDGNIVIGFDEARLRELLNLEP